MALTKSLIASRLAVAILAAVAIQMQAQINEGTIVGAARDSTGAVLAGARIDATNTDTNVSSSTITNETGEYIFRNVVPGHYRVTCTQPGFSKGVFSDLTLLGGTTSRIDFTLEVGELQQEVAVSSDAPLLQTENAAVGGS